MSELEFPTRTAGDLTLPNGDKVWVCQLNSRFHEEADSRARWFAQKEARVFLKGGREYPELLARVKEMDADAQSTFLADKQFWSIHTETLDKYPDPERPEQDGTPEAFAKAVMAWEEGCKKAAEKREKAEKSRYDAELKKNKALTAGVRIERCCEFYFRDEWAKSFVVRREMETLYRAVRADDDHTARYFKSPEEYEDSDDATQTALREFFYKTLTEPKHEDIPTSPAA